MTETMIAFHHVSKDYTLYDNNQSRFLALFSQKYKTKKHRALDDVSFSINRGESVALIGCNGAGKSTIMKMITGVAFPTEGTVEVNGKVAALLELKAGFSGDLTGRENIYQKGSILGLSKSEIQAIEEAVIAFADLDEYIDQPVRTYSSGMKMRLGFAINININPDILIVDEALSVGDSKFKKKCNKRIKELKKNGVTIVIVSHDRKAVKDMCDRAIFLENGKVVMDGPAETVLEAYED